MVVVRGEVAEVGGDAGVPGVREDNFGGMTGWHI
jgi:hypothetical protein